MVLWNSVNWTPHVDGGATSANRIIRSSCTQSRVPPSSRGFVFATLWFTIRKSPPSYAVIVERLAPAERPERCSTSRAKSVSLRRPQHHRGNSWNLYDSTLCIFSKMSFFSCVSLCVPLVRSGNHLRDLHGSPRQRLLVVPAG